ncbi:GAF domain-containing protein, partial [Patescibacteria group bacterium]|nr:GAF domain-containing protein [Patescibacteria group bacterium]
MIIPNGKIDLSHIIEGVGAGLCLLDKNFHILWVNKHQADWFGSPEKICGKYCYKTFEHRGQRCRGCPTVKVFKTGGVYSAHRIGFDQQGKKHYYDLTVSPIKDSRDRVAFALELVQDVTERVIQERHDNKINNKLKRMHQHLAQVNAQLFNNVARLKKVASGMHKVKSSLAAKYRKSESELAIIKSELQDIFKLNRSLTSTVDIKEICSLIVKLCSELTHADACILRLLETDRKSLAVNASYGIIEKFRDSLPVFKLGESVCGRSAKGRRPIVVDEIEGEVRIADQQALLQAGYHSILCIPVLFQDEVLGTVTTFSKEPRHFSKNEVDLLSMFASQITVAVQETRHYEDTHKNYFDTIHSLVLALEARDTYTRGHTERVTQYALELGRALGFSETELEMLRYASEVHDVGKIGIPDSILNKPGQLTPDERAVIEMHPVKGAEVLEPLEFLKSAIPIVRHHHERYDGKGYPD